MSSSPVASTPGLRERIASLIAAALIRTLAVTLRVRLDDRAGLSENPEPVIWAFWHNRILLMPWLHPRRFPKRKAVVLTSASRDGLMLASVVAQFGVRAVRGSSSRRGASAVRELSGWLARGHDAGITPDGPRGPRYQLSPGVVFLAQKTGAPIMPVHVEYSRCIRLKSWDRFMIPLPFSRVQITLGELQRVPPAEDPGAFEAERARIEQLLAPQTE